MIRLVQNRLYKALGRPHSEHYFIPLDTCASFSLVVKRWCFLETHYSKCGLKTQELVLLEPSLTGAESIKLNLHMTHACI